MFIHPRDGEYHGCLDGIYGGDVPLPAPFGFSLDTGSLPVYGT
ncbi:hypothetical protein [Nocardia heshunensis]